MWHPKYIMSLPSEKEITNMKIINNGRPNITGQSICETIDIDIDIDNIWKQGLHQLLLTLAVARDARKKRDANGGGGGGTVCVCCCFFYGGGGLGGGVRCNSSNN